MPLDSAISAFLHSKLGIPSPQGWWGYHVPTRLFHRRSIFPSLVPPVRLPGGIGWACKTFLQAGKLGWACESVFIGREVRVSLWECLHRENLLSLVPAVDCWDGLNWPLSACKVSSSTCNGHPTTGNCSSWWGHRVHPVQTEQKHFNVVCSCFICAALGECFVWMEQMLRESVELNELGNVS